MSIFSTIFAKSYSNSSNDDLLNDVKNCIKNKTLSKDDITDLLNFCTKGKTKSLVHQHSHKVTNIMDFLVKDHFQLIDTEHVTIILPHLPFHIEWLNNLVENGFKISDNHVIILREYSHEKYKKMYKIVLLKLITLNYSPNFWVAYFCLFLFLRIIKAYILCVKNISNHFLVMFLVFLIFGFSDWQLSGLTLAGKSLATFRKFCLPFESLKNEHTPNVFEL